MWPTAELHVHIEGTLEVPLLLTLAQRNDIALPSHDAAVLRARYEFSCLQDFLDVYYDNLAVLVHERDFADLALAYLQRAATAGVRRAEIFFDPQSHTSRGVAMGTVVRGLSRGIEQARELYGIDGALILCFLRHLGGDAAVATLREALPLREHFIGVGLDSSEVGFPPSLFREAFEIAAAEGLHRVAHAGEEGGPDYVWEALDVLGVERIDHGNRALEDAELMAVLRHRQIPLTVCPLSNVALRTASADLAEHPLPVMLDEGLLVSVHSDDPAYFGGYVDDNVAALRSAGVVSEATAGRLAANAVMSSFLDGDAKARLLDEVRAYGAARGIELLAPASAR
ncbi:adenosine deaminase [Microbacterium sp. Marseille-Q6965]|uniref:adenosine deaminase n=1 Tax=Microbacterium sp. Marseille-Q6965 TaxID=2965072 RepID=UPI0021B806A5|nr:adenosine deaminase [Microbacterium sp. Marseille-Q6965]